MAYATRRPLPIIGGAFTDNTRPFDLQDCVNYIVEPAMDTHQRAEGVLRGCPGLTTKVTLPTFPNRGLHDVEGQLFAVNGQELYSVDPVDGTYTALGAVPGVTRVTMAHNQIAGGYELVVAGGGLTDGYIYNTATATFSTITDPNFPGALRLDFIDEYVVGVASNGQFFFNSALADATTYPADNIYEASVQPDPLLSLIVNRDEIWAFGTRTIQPFTDTGALDIIFQTQPGTAMQVGCASTFCVQRIDNLGLFWLGNDGIVYNALGYMPTRISTFAVEQDIALRNKSECFAFIWIDRGHKVYYLTFPDGLTWGYDANSGIWHRRVSTGLNHWRVSDICNSNMTNYAGDFQNGNIYLIDWTNYTEAGIPLPAYRRMPYVHANQNWLRMSAIELVMQTNPGSQSDASMWMRYSDDYGTTWSYLNERQLIYGQRCTFNRLGRFRDRVFEFGCSSPVQRDIVACVGILNQ
jgi:hypothetical protein